MRVGIDVGGTFTDLALVDAASRLWTLKVASTPADPAQAILAGLRQLLSLAGVEPYQVDYLGHGTTVATNAIIERRGAKTGLVTTAGFKDLLEIRRQKRPHLYDLFEPKPVPLVPGDLRLEIVERTHADGSIERPLDPSEVVSAGDTLARQGVEAVAVVFLHSYIEPRPEQTAAAILRERHPDLYVSASHEVLPEFREFERLSTTVCNAYLGPLMARYLRHLVGGVADLGCRVAPHVMQSNGGIASAATAAELPIVTLYSGPSAGVIGAWNAAAAAGASGLITFDMGGTSTDVCLIQDGVPSVSAQREVAGYPVKQPMVGVQSVGAGGGSIASLDSGGHLQVGPRSAGATPGPACYGRGGSQPTVTDADLVLGRLGASQLLAGGLELKEGLARAAIDRHVAASRKQTTEAAAAAIVQIVDANVARAIRGITVQVGHDPRAATLVAFGGAGPLHAAAVARLLDVKHVLVPPAPGILCALGLLAADVRADFATSRLLDTGDVAGIENTFLALERRARSWLEREVRGVGELSRSVDARYVGQNHELTVPVPEGALDERTLTEVGNRFHHAHEAAYGYAAGDQRVQIVTLRVRATHRTGSVPTSSAHSTTPTGPRSRRRVYLEETGFVDCPVVLRGDLARDQALTGPAIVEQMDATTLVPSDARAHVDTVGNLRIELGER
ncbi:MAG: hydantoinase/oxoprolinase family protein [Chloroflexi bacterium]|nr:hydantoinase/oxoprolinase family protein [Chloroflexota bacterium]